MRRERALFARDERGMLPARPPLNILHVIGNLQPGGVERLLTKTLGVIDRKRFVHHVCCVSAGGFYRSQIETLGISCWVMNRRVRFDPTVIAQMVLLLRRLRIDVMHTLNFTANAWGRIAGKIARVPTIIAHERGTAWTETAAMRQVDRALYRWTDRLLANSQAAKTMLTQHVGVPSDRIRVLYNGVPIPGDESQAGYGLRGRLDIGADTPLIGTLGRLDTSKGIGFLLQAIPIVWEAVPDAHFVIIGDGPLRASLESRARQMGLLGSGKLRFLGFLPEAVSVLGEVDLVVHPSIRESLGNTLIEAAAAGKPVVCSNVDGCPEVVVHGATGILVDCTAPVETVNAPGASPMPSVVVDGRSRTLRPPLGPGPELLARAVVNLCRNPDLREQMGREGRERAHRVFRLERFTADLEDIYLGR